MNNKKLELIRKVFFFEKNKPENFQNGFGIKYDWAKFLNEKNPQNMYPFVSELIKRKILVLDKVIIKNNREEIKYKLNKKLSLGEGGGHQYRVNLRKMVRETDEGEIISDMFTLWM